MKKFITLVFALVFLYSCNDSPESLGTTSEIAGNVVINAAQTQGVADSYNEAISQDLNQIIPNLSSVTSITVNRLSFLYGNVSGNANAVIESGTLIINGVTIATLTDVNVTDEANNENVISITQQSILNQVGAKLLSDGFISIEFIGTILSDDDPVNFTIVVSISTTAAL